MKTQQLLIAVFACIVGALGYAMITTNKASDDDKNEIEALRKQLAEANARLDAVESEAKPKVASATKSESIDLGLIDDAFPDDGDSSDDPENGDGEESDDPLAQFAKIVNSKEARSLMKQFATAMAGQSSPWIKRELSRYTDTLGLTEEQVSALSEKMGAKASEMAEEFAEGLDDETKTVQEYMQEQGERWATRANEFDAIMQDTLTDEQFENYEQQQLVQRAEIIERQAERELNQLNESLDLTESQQDQVFGVLVQKSPLYDERMGIGTVESGAGSSGAAIGAGAGFIVGETEGAIIGAAAGEDAGDASEAVAGAGVGALPDEVTVEVVPEPELVDTVEIDDSVSKEDAIRSVLTDEQREIYNESLQNPAPRGPGGFGGFPGF